MNLHPLCTLFPRLEGAEFDALKNDIRVNGLRQPVVLHEGMILDGGNRYRACVELGIEPSTIDYAGNDATAFVLSANLHRRHMTAGQQATIVALATDWSKANSHGGNRRSDQAALVPLETVSDRAMASGAGERTQRKADKLVKEHPELAKQVTSGEKSLYQAVKETKQVETKEAQYDDEIDLAQLASELQKENEAYQRKIASIESDDLAAEVVRLNTQLDQLNGRLQGEITTRNEAQKQAKYYADLLGKIRKILNVETNKEILTKLTK